MARKKTIPFSQINADEAFKIHQRIRDREQVRRALMVDNIKDLVYMFETEEYKAILGQDPKPTWAMYLAQIEVLYPRSKVEVWRRMINKYCIELGAEPADFLEIPITRLEELLPVHIISKDELLDWFQKAKTMIPSDWKDEIRSARGLITTDQCKHEKIEIFSICSVCGQRHRESPALAHEQKDSGV